MSVATPIRGRINPHIELAPFAILRVGGLPTSTVRDVLSGSLAAPLEQIRNAQRALSLHREFLEDALFQWVRILGNDKFRHRVLALRRDIHNDRAAQLATDPEMQKRLAGFSVQAVEVLLAWDTSVRRYQAGLAAVGSAEAHLDSIDFAKSLLSLFEIERFALGMSHSCPTIFYNCEKIAAGKMKPSAISGFINTVLSYAIRAGTKTSPLTTFMQCCMIDVVDGQEDTPLDFSRAKLRSVSGLDRSIFLRLREKLLAGNRLAKGIPLRRNPTLQFLENNQVRYWAASSAIHNEKTWRRNSLKRVKVSTAIFSILRGLDGEITAAALSAELTEKGISDQEAHELVGILLDKAIVISTPGRGLDDLDIASRHTAWIRKIVPETDSTVLDELNGMNRDCAAFANLNVAERVGLATRIDARTSALHRMSDVVENGQQAATVFENSWWEPVGGHLGKRFSRSAHRALSVIGRRLVPSAEYLWLRDFFVTQYGAGGICDHLLEFLGTAAEAFPSDRRALWASMAGRNPHMDLSGLQVPVSFHAQFVDGERMHPSDPDIVINAVYPRGIWQLSRYSVSPLDEGLSTRIRKWLSHCAAPAEAVAVVYSGEDINLQNHGRLTNRSINFEMTEGDDRIDVANLELEHDRETGRLICREKGGPVIRPFYLGGAVPDPQFGPSYYLTLIGEPLYVRLAPPRLMLSRVGQIETVRRQARVVEEGCILIRQTWYIKSRDLLTAVCTSSSEFSTNAVAFDRFFRSEGIPLEGFVFGQTNDAWRTLAPDMWRFRKPMWFSLSDAWSMRRVLRIASEMDYLVVREAIPAIDDATVMIQGKPHVAEYHIEALLTTNGNKGTPP